MHHQLAKSLAHIQERCAGIVAFDHAALTRLISDLDRGARYPASTFALYYELVPALLNGDEPAARALFDALGCARPIQSPLRVLGLADPALAAHRERYVRLMNSGQPCTLDFLPPTPQQADAFAARFDEVRDLMARTVPDLLEEMRAMISEIILVTGSATDKMRFDGGSSYQLWGALFLNAEHHRSRVELVEVLAHESGHSVLFGLSTEEAPVLNADDERFPSPLRVERRPMDGVFHATYVSARMHWAMSRLIDSGQLSEEETSLAMKARSEDRRNFEQGYETVAAHARLTEVGRRALDAALSYMRNAA